MNEKKSAEIQPRHILIIGGAGYIGSVLTRKLLLQGHRVRILDPLLYQNGASIAPLMTHPGFSFVNGSFGEQTVLQQALAGITDVVLLAALVGDPICKKYPDLARDVNLNFPKQLVAKLQEHRIDRLVFTSTCSNYGLIANDQPASETHPLNPKSLYAETKVAFEQYILEHLDELSFCPTLLRIATAFGISDRMRFDLTISEFTRELTIGKELLVYDAHTWRPYCHIADISAAIIRVMDAPAGKVRGEVFNVGSDHANYTKQMVVDAVLQYLPQSQVRYREGDFDPRNYRVNFEKIREVLDFAPSFTVESAIQRLIKALNGGLYEDYELRKGFYRNMVVG
jgi:nucleoside-diphosphate-sugar epimerase